MFLCCCCGLYAGGFGGWYGAEVGATVDDCCCGGAGAGVSSGMTKVCSWDWSVPTTTEFGSDGAWLSGGESNFKKF